MHRLVESHRLLSFRIKHQPRHRGEHQGAVPRRPRHRPHVVQVATCLARHLVRHELDDPDAPDHAHLADNGQRTEWREAHAELPLEAHNAIEHGLVPKDVEARQRHRARKRIGREGVAVKERPAPILAQKRLVDRF